LAINIDHTPCSSDGFLIVASHHANSTHSTMHVYATSDGNDAIRLVQTNSRASQPCSLKVYTTFRLPKQPYLLGTGGKWIRH